MATYLQHSLIALQRTLPDAALEITQLPTVEEIKLALINADFQTGPLPADVMRDVIALQPTGPFVGAAVSLGTLVAQFF